MKERHGQMIGGASPLLDGVLDDGGIATRLADMERLRQAAETPAPKARGVFGGFIELCKKWLNLWIGKN